MKKERETQREKMDIEGIQTHSLHLLHSWHRANSSAVSRLCASQGKTVNRGAQSVAGGMKGTGPTLCDTADLLEARSTSEGREFIKGLYVSLNPHPPTPLVKGRADAACLSLQQEQR